MDAKRILHFCLALVTAGGVLISSAQTVQAQTPLPTGTQASTQTAATETSNPSLCLPYMESSASLHCLQAGPSQQLSDLANQGITFPPAPLTVVQPPVDLANIPYSYAKVVNDAVPMYASVDDAVAGVVKETMPAGKFKYVSLMQKASGSDGNTYYQIANEDWISGSVISRVSPTYFQGFLINNLPSVPFGWVVISGEPSYVAPDFNAAQTGNTYNRQDLIRCYETKQVNGTDWVRIGASEWIEGRFVGCVINNPTPPQGVTNGRWIEVNLQQQVLTVYDNSKMVFATLVSSGGKPFYTRPGTFKITRKVDFEYMTGAFEADRSDYYYIEQVPYIMYFDDARALHGAYWNNYLGNPGSHGCVNLSVADAHWLYDWANEGDTVYVWDPSGQTPTDPSLYGPGGF